MASRSWRKTYGFLPRRFPETAFRLALMFFIVLLLDPGKAIIVQSDKTEDMCCKQFR